MSIEKVKKYFAGFNLTDRIYEFDSSSATVALAAEALGCEPCRIAKSMSFDLNSKTIIVVMAGDVKTDNSKYKAKFGTKAKMLSLDEVEVRTGHRPGGVCPFIVNDDVDIYLDESLKRFDTVFPAAGSSNSAIELTITELEEHSNYKEWVDVSKPA